MSYAERFAIVVAVDFAVDFIIPARFVTPPVPMAPPNSPPTIRIGCGAMLVTTIVTCVLLAVNGWIAHRVVLQLQGLTPDWIGRPKMAQAAVFILPVAFLVMEWWIIDWVRDVWNASRSSGGKEG